MTQFLLVASEQPYAKFPGLVFTPSGDNPFLSMAASVLFPTQVTPIWSVAPPGTEAGHLAYEARDAADAGESVENTTLGRLLQHAMNRQNSFALFYASDFEQLPIARTSQNLFRIIGEQLRVEDGCNLELYVQWRHDA